MISKENISEELLNESVDSVTPEEREKLDNKLYKERFNVKPKKEIPPEPKISRGRLIIIILLFVFIVTIPAGIVIGLIEWSGVRREKKMWKAKYNIN
jgi:hypothetical protein